jgi:hypothetical protein
VKRIAAGLFTVTSLVAVSASADDTIKLPGDHPHYSVEIEPHGLLGWSANYYGTGFGLGGRITIILTHDGFVKTINNSVGIGFGLDWVHYSGPSCYSFYRGICYGGFDANFIQFPVVMQWNFYVAQHWSVFAEPGLYIWHGFYDTNYPCNGPGLPPCGFYNYTDTSIGPAFYIGGRYHFSDSVALTMRIGYPTLSVGVSFMP